MTRILLIATGVVLVLIIGGALVFPMLVPKEALEARIEAAATEALGRQVTIEGAPEIRLFPTSARVSGLVVANAPGFEAPYLLKVGEAAIGVKLLPLLSQRIEITRFDLTAPEINLEQRQDGSANWILGAEEAEGASSPEEPAALPDIRLGTVTVTDGTIGYDPGDGRAFRAEEAELTLTLPSLEDRLDLKGEAVVDGRPATLTATLTTPGSLMREESASVLIDAQIGQNAIEAEITLGEDMAFGGAVDIDAPALRDLLAFIGAEIEAEAGFERLRLAGEMAGNAERIAFAEGTRLTFDAIEGTGNIVIDLSGVRPSVTGAVRTGALDLRPYVPSEAPAAPRDQDAPFPPWSEVPIDFSALGAADADLSFAADAILLPDISVGQSAARLVLRNSRLRLDLERMDAYDGSGSGVLTVDAGGATPLIAADVTLVDIDAAAFAGEVLDTDRLKGRGDVRFDVRTAGDSQADFVRNLSGTGRAALEDGAIQGVNLGKATRATLGAVQQLRQGGIKAPALAATLTTLLSETKGPAQETDFNDLTMILDIEDGVVTSETIRLDGPYYTIAGKGIVDLPQQTARLTLDPAATLPGEDAPRRLPVPLLVGGTFTEPSFGVDAAPLLRSLAGDKARSLLEERGVPIGEGEKIEDALRRRASDEIGRLLTPEKEETTDGETAPEEDAGTEPPAAQDVLIERGLDALFGPKKKAEEPAGEDG